jgi:hypothetical protein
MAHAVDAIDFDLPLFVFDKLFEIGLGFLAVGLAREFVPLGVSGASMPSILMRSLAWLDVITATVSPSAT